MHSKYMHVQYPYYLTYFFFLVLEYELVEKRVRRYNHVAGANAIGVTVLVRGTVGLACAGLFLACHLLGQ